MGVVVQGNNPFVFYIIQAVINCYDFSFKSFELLDERAGAGKSDAECSESLEGTERRVNPAGTVSPESPESPYFVTDNPHSPVIAEDLMRRGISVTVAKDSGEILSLIFDLIFYLIFFGIIFLDFRKFISPNTFKVVHKTGVKFDDVVGMDKLKRDMEQVMEIMKHPAQYAAKGIRIPKGILLEGETGNGKTLFAKALAG